MDEPIDHAGRGAQSRPDRREALAALLAIGGAAALSGGAIAEPAAGSAPARKPGRFTAAAMGWDAEKREYALPRLPYAADALEPHIDAQTMEIHHAKHHAAYVAGLNKAVAELAKIRAGEGDALLIKHWSREAAFHGGGHVNHCLFWLTLAPTERARDMKPGPELSTQIDRDFGSLEKCMNQMSAAASAVEGSGWAWLVWEPIGQRLLITQMEKQQNLWVTGASPLLGVDVWEHAYYLRYQNRRADYLKAWRQVIDWGAVDELFAAARA